MTYVLGIDLGTQSVKTGLLDVKTGELRHMASRGYSGGALQSPGELWNATLESVSETVEQGGGDTGAIAALGLSGQMHGTVLFGAGDDIIGEIINWQDERCNLPLDRYGGRTTIDHMLEMIPGPHQEDLGIDRMASGFQGATLFHIKENQPDLFARIHHVLTPTDFIRRQLVGGGDYTTDPTNAFGTGVYNTRENCWHQAVFETLGLDPDIFPGVIPTDTVAGEVCAFVARRTGLRRGTPVAVGGGDNQMAMIGCGALHPGGPVCINIGTSSQICAVSADWRRIPGIDTRSFVGGSFALVYAGLTGGKSYTWLRNMLLADLASVHATTMQASDLFKHMDSLAEKAPPGCAGLRFEPTLRGTRRDPSARGAFTGVSEKNFFLGFRARAVMEGVVNELRQAYDAMGVQGASGLVGVGNGLVRSRLWRQIAAAAFGSPLHVTDFENAVCGAALVAAQAVGLCRIPDVPIQYAYMDQP